MRCHTCNTTVNLRYANCCVTCDNKQKTAKRKANHDTVLKQMRSSEMPRWYGISIEMRDAMFTVQDGCCAICKKPEGASAFGIDRLQVDHCHTCLAVRGLVCNTCNGRIQRHEKGTNVPDELIAVLDTYIDERCEDECKTRILVALRSRLVAAE